MKLLGKKLKHKNWPGKRFQVTRIAKGIVYFRALDWPDNNLLCHESAETFLSNVEQWLEN